MVILEVIRGITTVLLKPLIAFGLAPSFFVLFSWAAHATDELHSHSGANGNQWIPLSPEEGSVQALVIDRTNPSTLYAGTEGAGVFRSTDGGDTWTAINTGLVARQSLSSGTRAIRYLLFGLAKISLP